MASFFAVLLSAQKDHLSQMNPLNNSDRIRTIFTEITLIPHYLHDIVLKSYERHDVRNIIRVTGGQCAAAQDPGLYHQEFCRKRCRVRSVFTGSLDLVKPGFFICPDRTVLMTVK